MKLDLDIDDELVASIALPILKDSLEVVKGSPFFEHGDKDALEDAKALERVIEFYGG